MEISLVTYGFNKDREGIEHLKWICDLCRLSVSQCLLKSHLSCLASNIYFVLNSAKVKKIGNVTVKNYLNESLLSLLICALLFTVKVLSKRV